MPIYQLEDIPEEFVTPKHSTAYGRLITGTQVEVGNMPILMSGFSSF